LTILPSWLLRNISLLRNWYTLIHSNRGRERASWRKYLPTSRGRTSFKGKSELERGEKVRKEENISQYQGERVLSGSEF